MLREIVNTRQDPDEPPRRFFFSHQQDLWVWFDDGETAGVLERFLELSAEMPQEIVGFVAARLREHPEFRATSPPSP